MKLVLEQIFERLRVPVGEELGLPPDDPRVSRYILAFAAGDFERRTGRSAALELIEWGGVELAEKAA
jgi:hypothetical protein